MSSFNHGNAGFRVCIDSSDGGNVSGTVYSRRLTEPMKFADLGSLILNMDQVLDAQKFPQAFQRSRSFKGGQRRSECEIAAPSPEEGLEAETVATAVGKLLTFEVFVISRRGSSWQGSIDWLDGNPRAEFSSALEIIRMTDARLLSGI